MEGARSHRIPFLSALCGIFFLSTAALGADCADEYFLSLKVKSNCEESHYLPVGVGVSSPSVGATYIENPAGFIYNDETKAHISWSKAKRHDATARYGSTGLGGNGTIGGGLGLSIHRVRGDADYTATVATYGTALYVSGLDVAIGFSGATGINRSGSEIASDDANFVRSNIGILFNAKGAGRVGFTAYDPLHGTKAYGIGLTAPAARNLTFSMDGVFSTQAKLGAVKAALGTSYSIFLVTAGLGLRNRRAGVDLRVPSGLSLSLGVVPSKSFRVVFSYNQIDQVYVGITSVW